MITVVNESDNYILVYSETFSIQVPYKSKVEIDKENLKGNYNLSFRYNGFNEEKTDVCFDIKPTGFRKIFFPQLEYRASFPMVTIINVEEVEKVVVKENDVPIGTLMFFKRICLKELMCDTGYWVVEKEKKKILKRSDKESLLKQIRKSFLFTTPVFLSALGIGVWQSLLNISKPGVMICWSIMLLLVSWCWAQDLIYYFIIKKREVEIEDHS